MSKTFWQICVTRVVDRSRTVVCKCLKIPVDALVVDIEGVIFILQSAHTSFFPISSLDSFVTADDEVTHHVLR